MNKKNIFPVTLVNVFLAVVGFSLAINAGFEGRNKIFYLIYLLTVWGAITLLFKSNFRAKNLVIVSAFLSYMCIYSYLKIISVTMNLYLLNLFIVFHIFIALLSIFISSYRSALLKIVVFLIYTTLISIVGCCVIFYNMTGKITEDVVNAILQSNPSEAIEYLIHFLPVKLFVVVLLFALILFLILIISLKNNDEISLQSIGILVLICFLLSLQPHQLGTFKDIKKIEGWVNNFSKEIEGWRKIKNQRQTGDIGASTKKKGQLHVVVIGESLAKYNLSAYGYPVDTTPWLSSSDNIKLTQAYSNHTHTVPVLSRSLTQSNQYNGKTYYETPSVIQVAQAAKYKVAWLSTQVRIGTWDNMVSIVADDADYKKFLNSGTVGRRFDVRHKDKALVPYLKRYLAKLDDEKNNIIFIHTMGSHINYCSRIDNEKMATFNYPEGLFNHKENQCYDKSVKYTDEFLQSVYQLVSAKKSFTSMVFMADHAEDVFNNLGHNSAYFTEYMAQIPFVVWTSDKLNKEITHNLINNKNKIYTNDLFFDTLLGLWSVDTPLKNLQFDLTSKEYRLDNPLTLQGKKRILELPVQVARRNVANNKNFMANGVNTIGSMFDAKLQGFKNIKVDIFFDEEAKEIIVGSGKSASREMSLHEYLTYEKGYFNRLWLDLKGVSDENLNITLDKLNQLDMEFNLKKRTLLGSDYTGWKFSIFRDNAWFTSYHLPKNKFFEYKKPEDIKQYLQGLNLQLKLQKVLSISFDYEINKHIIEYFTRQKVTEMGLELNTCLSLSADDKDFDKKLVDAHLAHLPKLHSVTIQPVTRFMLNTDQNP